MNTAGGWVHIRNGVIMVQDGTYHVRMEWGGWETADIEPDYYTVRLWSAGKIVPSCIWTAHLFMSEVIRVGN